MNDFGRTNFRKLEELGPKGLREISHLVKVADKMTMHSARKLPGTKRLLADRFAPGLKTGRIEVEKIDACSRLRRSRSGLFALVRVDERFGH